MSGRGFTLIELVVVMAIAGILLAIGTLQFGQYSRKSAVEGEAKMIFADIMNARNQALFQRRARSLSINGAAFSIYSSDVTSVSPIQQKTLSYPVKTGSSTSITMTFDTMGLYTGTDGTCICVNTGSANDAAVDGIVLSPTRIEMGKWNEPGGDCSSGKIGY